MKVFDIGFSKTGTTSMEAALGMLGYNVCRGNCNSRHTYYLLASWINEDYDEIFRMVRYWNAFADGPWGGTDLYKRIDERIPNAKFILTVRPSKDWYRSFRWMFTGGGGLSKTIFNDAHRSIFGTVHFFETVFQIKNLDQQAIIAGYEAHNQGAIDYFSGTGKLLVLNVPQDLAWRKLCPFLGKKIPKRPFPWRNKTEYK